MSRQRGFPPSPRSYANIEVIADQARAALVPSKQLTKALSGVMLFEQLDAYTGNGVPLDYQVKPLPREVEV